MLLKIGFTNITQNWFHKRYSKLVSQTLLEIRFTSVTQISFTNFTQNWFHKRYSKLASQGVLAKPCHQNASKFKENFIIYLNLLAFSLQTSLHFQTFLKIMKGQWRVFYFWVVVYQPTQSNFKHYRPFAHFKFQNLIANESFFFFKFLKYFTLVIG